MLCSWKESQDSYWIATMNNQRPLLVCFLLKRKPGLILDCDTHLGTFRIIGTEYWKESQDSYWIATYRMTIFRKQFDSLKRKPGLILDCDRPSLLERQRIFLTEKKARTHTGLRPSIPSAFYCLGIDHWKESQDSYWIATILAWQPLLARARLKRKPGLILDCDPGWSLSILTQPSTEKKARTHTGLRLYYFSHIFFTSFILKRKPGLILDCDLSTSSCSQKMLMRLKRKPGLILDCDKLLRCRRQSAARNTEKKARTHTGLRRWVEPRVTSVTRELKRKPGLILDCDLLLGRRIRWPSPPIEKKARTHTGLRPTFPQRNVLIENYWKESQDS